jgi:hypothetical protein
MADQRGVRWAGGGKNRHYGCSKMNPTDVVAKERWSKCKIITPWTMHNGDNGQTREVHERHKVREKKVGAAPSRGGIERGRTDCYYYTDRHRIFFYLFFIHSFLRTGVWVFTILLPAPLPSPLSTLSGLNNRWCSFGGWM